MIPLVMSVIAKTETFQRDMAKARGHVGQFGKSVKSTSTIMTGFSRQLLALAGVGGGLYALKSGLTSSISTFASFEKGMANVSTLLDNQSMRLLPEYSDQVRKMSMTFGEGTEILSKGLYDIISASVEPSKAMKVLEVSVKAAKAGMSDTAVAADALTTILNSYGYQAEEASRISDILFTTIRRGKTTFGELAPNIGKVASVAATAGLSFEEMSAAIATMTRAGVQTEIAITSLRALILSFLQPQNESIEAARKYGVELNSNTLKVEGLTGVIKKLEKATAEELATIIPTSRAIAGFAAAIKNAAGNAEDYKAALDSLGTTEEAYQKMADITATKLDITKQHWLDLKRTIGEEVAPALNELLPILNKTIDMLDKMSPALLILREINTLRNIPKFKGGRGGRFGGKGAAGGWEMPETNAPFSGYQYLTPELPAFDEKAMQEAIDDNEKASYDMAQAYVRMYNEINSKSKESYEWRKKLINEEYNLYAEKVKDKILLEELRQERLRQLAIEQAKATGGFVEGFGAGIAEMQDKMQTIGELGADVAETFRDGMVDGLNEALWKAQDLEDAMKELGITIAKMVTQWLLMQAVTNTMSAIGLGGTGMAASMTAAGSMAATALTTAGTTVSTTLISAGTTVSSSIIAAGEVAAASIAAASMGSSIGGAAHSGGMVGHTGFRLRAVPASTFVGAPRLHKGLMNDEYPAILQTGEQVIPRGGAKNNGLENKLDTLISIMSERQTINANIIDRRDVITRERIESREGEQWTMKHIQRNS